MAHRSQGVGRAPKPDGRDPGADRRTPGGLARAWTLSPTDLTFLWEECPRCFYRKVALREPRPRSPFPTVFSRIDRAMKDFYLGERAEVLVPGMPTGVIGGGDRWVKSVPIVPPGCDSACLIRGRVDVLVACDDGSVGIVDFKTAEPCPGSLDKYSRQLHAYALALEHPARGAPVRVGTIGLLCFSPDRFQDQCPARRPPRRAPMGRARAR